MSGAILAEASERDIKKLEDFGYKLGLAFQIKDDILDVVGNAKDLGKNVHKDQESNKNNYITIFGLEECKKKCVNITEECIDILSSIEGNIEPLKSFNHETFREKILIMKDLVLMSEILQKITDPKEIKGFR